MRGPLPGSARCRHHPNHFLFLKESSTMIQRHLSATALAVCCAFASGATWAQGATPPPQNVLQLSATSGLGCYVRMVSSGTRYLLAGLAATLRQGQAPRLQRLSAIGLPAQEARESVGA